MFEIKGKLVGIKNFVFDHSGEKRNIEAMEQKGNIVTEFRICNSSNNNTYVNGVVVGAEKKIYFASTYVVEIGSVLVDKYLNLYKIIAANKNKNELIGNDVITTICNYVDFVPNNPARNIIYQNARIEQGVSNNTFSNVGSIVLNIEQKATIEQSISVYQMVETVEDEAKYRFEPIKSLSDFLSLVRDILKGSKTIDELKNKIVDIILKESSSFLKDMIELLIKNIKKKADETGRYCS